jgi:CheY-like chemotaxis protein
MRPTVLLLEDSKTQALVIEKMIESAGWSVIHCETMREALDSLKLISVQALMLDVFVSQHNTLLHLEQFRKLARDVPLLVMTAGSSQHGIDITLKLARNAGADYVLRKPFNETLIANIFSSLTAGPEGRLKHVLVIDDSRTVRKFARKALELKAYRVSEANTMEEAFSDIDIAHVDLVLCDVFMPGMGGLKGIRMIKQTWPEVKIISMSAGIEDRVSETDALNATRKIGADAQISKPFSAADIGNLAEEVMQKELA